MKKELLIAIVDDNAETRKRIIARIDSLFKEKQISINVMSFPEGKSYTESLSSYSYDITFMDIEMPYEDGISIASGLMNEKKIGRLVYVSNREDRVFDSFMTHPFGFVRKSHFEEDCPKVIDSILEAMHKETNNTLVLKTSEGPMTFQLSDVIYIETEGRKSALHIKGFNEPVVFSLPISEFAKSLAPNGFITTYKGFLVNVLFIKRITVDGVLLETGENLPVSRRKVTELKKAYMHSLSSSMAMIF